MARKVWGGLGAGMLGVGLRIYIHNVYVSSLSVIVRRAHVERERVRKKERRASAPVRPRGGWR